MSTIPYIPLIPKDYHGHVPEVIENWKYTDKVRIDNIGCPTQIEVPLDQEGFETAPLLYIRLRCGSCVVAFYPSGEITDGERILYSTKVTDEVLTTATAFKLFETVIPLASMAVALHKNGITVPEVAPVFSIFSESYTKRKRDEVAPTTLRQDEDKEKGPQEKRTRAGNAIEVN